MLFFLPGVDEMLRINGVAAITTEESLMTRFVHESKRPLDGRRPHRFVREDRAGEDIAGCMRD